MIAWRYILFDIEANGFKPDKIWVLCMRCLITGERITASSQDDIAKAIMILSMAELIVGHNIKGYDLRVIEKMMGGLIEFDRSKVIDTLHLSRKVVKMPKHDLETWGEILGFPKLPVEFSFYNFDPRMLPYCERDVDLNYEIFKTLIGLMVS